MSAVDGVGGLPIFYIVGARLAAIVQRAEVLKPDHLTYNSLQGIFRLDNGCRPAVITEGTPKWRLLFPNLLFPSLRLARNSFRPLWVGWSSWPRWGGSAGNTSR